MFRKMNNAHDNVGPRLRIGLFAIGLDAYWPQFDGLEERLNVAAAKVAERLGRPGIEVVNLGMIDNPEKAASAGQEFRRACVDLMFLACHDLCPVVDCPAGCTRGESPGDRSEPRPTSGYRLFRV